jgi:hypothetical protein
MKDNPLVERERIAINLIINKNTLEIFKVFSKTKIHAHIVRERGGGGGC